MFDLDKIWNTILAVLLAVVGGLARIFNVKNNKKMKWSMIFSEIFISAFSGLIVCLIAQASGVTGEWVGVLSGISGWIGPRVLDTAIKFINKAVGIDLSSDNKKEK